MGQAVCMCRYDEAVRSKQREDATQDICLGQHVTRANHSRFLSSILRYEPSSIWLLEKADNENLLQHHEVI